MNWFNGSIAEAVTSSKQKKAIFVVFVEGSDENSIKLTRFLDEPKIKEKLEGDNFVAIRIEGGSESYMQFARIYQIVPVPSLFFIGNNGTPLEIGTGVIASADELDRKIENVLKSSGKSSAAASSASAAFISAEQKSDTESHISTTPTTETTEEEIQTKDLSDSADSKSVEVVEPKTTDDTAPTTSSLSSSELPTSILDTQPEMSADPEPEIGATTSSGESPKPKVFCNDAVCYKLPNYETKPYQLQHAASAEETADPQSENASTCAESISMDTVPTPPLTAPTPPATPPESRSPTKQTPAATPNSEKKESLPASPVAATNTEVKAKLEREKVLLEERRKLKEAEEDRKAREGELSRRKEGKNAQNVQKWQKEEDFKEVRENIRRDRLKDEAARQRTLELIASDRAERANKFSPPAAASASPNAAGTTPTPLNAPSSSDVCRLQFRIPNGETSAQTFENSDPFAKVRAYVKAEVVKGTGIRDFILATTFPKHEFTDEDDAQTLLALGLCPSAVILVIAKASSGPSAVVARSGGVINVFNTIFWALMSPVMAVFGYLRNFVIGRNDGDASARPPPTTGAQKRANEERIDANDSAKKRNLDRFGLNKDGPSTSRDALATANATGGAYRRSGGSNIHRLSDQRKDSDDENNTWNGNSTQQQ